MSGDPTGVLRLQADGKEYRLHMGTSVLAALQGLHGAAVMTALAPPEGAGDGWLPDMQVVHDLFRLSLERYHGEVDRWTVDDLIAQNSGAIARLLGASMPDAPEGAAGNAAARGRKARSTSGS